jgi:hypothetical protein
VVGVAYKEGEMEAYGRCVGARLLAVVAVSAGFAFIVAAPASAATVQLAGVQSAPVDSTVCPNQTPNQPAYTMAGGLIGCWYTDSFNPHNPNGTPSGNFQGTGTEHFVGCLDLNGDGTCGADDPSGTLSFTYQVSIKFDVVTGAEIHGRCQHPIVSGTGDFAGATGVITFNDDVASGTAPYKGHISL